ncbi:hypothetical protein [Thermotalea metallivorans]|uniref:Uncharacterized protein n=1 Tax=Thermotalea metallivorans TaxID=520762 RepID=A0A140L4V9_9FIRM|nr:hypothetical protein [Thermotalea metallivorans]KXG75584.1 hypothetical protein AN619_15800 [Thermotalea metallivorans]
MNIYFCHNDKGDLLLNVLVSDEESYSFNFSEEGGMEKANEFLEALQKALPKDILGTYSTIEELNRIAADIK